MTDEPLLTLAMVCFAVAIACRIAILVVDVIT